MLIVVFNNATLPTLTIYHKTMPRDNELMAAHKELLRLIFHAHLFYPTFGSNALVEDQPTRDAHQYRVSLFAKAVAPLFWVIVRYVSIIVFMRCV